MRRRAGDNLGVGVGRKRSVLALSGQCDVRNMRSWSCPEKPSPGRDVPRSGRAGETHPRSSGAGGWDRKSRVVPAALRGPSAPWGFETNQLNCVSGAFALLQVTCFPICLNFFEN